MFDGLRQAAAGFPIHLYYLETTQEIICQLIGRILAEEAHTTLMTTPVVNHNFKVREGNL